MAGRHDDCGFWFKIAKGAECLGHGPLGVEDGQDVTDACLATSGEFIKAADSDAEGELHGGSGN
jgi:hypothetical protein